MPQESKIVERSPVEHTCFRINQIARGFAEGTFNLWDAASIGGFTELLDLLHASKLEEKDARQAVRDLEVTLKLLEDAKMRIFMINTIRLLIEHLKSRYCL